jgi:hypothetical protein
VDVPRRLYGLAEATVLPAAGRRLELALSASEARPGDRITVTATNPLDVDIAYSPLVGCADPIILDPLGLEPSCLRCPLLDPPGGGSTIPPGGTVTTEIQVPTSGFCGAVHPGRWSVIWGRYFQVASGPEAGRPAYGHAALDVRAAEPGALFIRGDCDGSRVIDLTDPVFLLGVLFLGASAPRCPDACDADDSGALDLTDAIAMLGYIFLGDAQPPSPFPDPGVDPTPDALGCE